MHRQRFEDIALLRHPANAGRRTPVRGQLVQVQRHACAEQPDAAAMLARGAGHGIDQGGLARAVAPQQCQRLARRQLQRYAMQHHRFAVAGAQIIDSQQISHAAPRLRVPDRPP